MHTPNEILAGWYNTIDILKPEKNIQNLIKQNCKPSESLSKTASKI